MTEKLGIEPGDLVCPGDNSHGWAVAADGAWLMGRFATYGLLVSMVGNRGLVFFPEYMRHAHVGLQGLIRFIDLPSPRVGLDRLDEWVSTEPGQT